MVHYEVLRVLPAQARCGAPAVRIQIGEVAQVAVLFDGTDVLNRVEIGSLIRHKGNRPMASLQVLQDVHITLQDVVLFLSTALAGAASVPVTLIETEPRLGQVSVVEVAAVVQVLHLLLFAKFEAAPVPPQQSESNSVFVGPSYVLGHSFQSGFFRVSIEGEVVRLFIEVEDDAARLLLVQRLGSVQSSYAPPLVKDLHQEDQLSFLTEKLHFILYGGQERRV